MNPLERLEVLEKELRELPKLMIKGPNYMYPNLLTLIFNSNLNRTLDLLINFYFIKNNTVLLEKEEVETEAGKHRSVNHIYRLLISTYPHIKLIDVYKVLYKLFEDGKIYSIFCTTIYLRTFIPGVDERNFKERFNTDSFRDIELRYYKEANFWDVINYIKEHEVQDKN